MKYLIIMMLLLSACKGNSGATIVGPKGDIGPIGDTGPAGINGTNGSNGTNGQDGAVGPKGADGTIITPIQFCPNVHPVYPSTFPEYGVCINGNIFAVYSANDGFLALIPPGVYSSNAIGSSCTFTVLANCQIQ